MTHGHQWHLKRLECAVIMAMGAAAFMQADAGESILLIQSRNTEVRAMADGVQAQLSQRYSVTSSAKYRKAQDFSSAVG
jgi:hypothetical protein